MDSLFRRYYIPKLVIREVQLSESSFLNEIPEEYTSKSKQLLPTNHGQNECLKCHAPMKEDWFACPKCGFKK